MGADESGEDAEDGRVDGVSGERDGDAAKRAPVAAVGAAVAVRVGVAAAADSVNFYVLYIYIIPGSRASG